MVLSTNPLKQFAKVQRAPDGRLLGVAIFLPADIIEPFVTDGADEIEYKLIRMPGGVHIEIAGDPV